MIGTLESRVRAWLAAARQGDWDVANRIAGLMPPGEYAMVRTAVLARCDQLERGNAAPPCPECVQGKHPNCDGTTWDVERDESAPCPCAARSHAT